jgi:hypothetical protein
MTAIDEISVRTPDALYNGSAVVDVIRSCIPHINDPWAVLSVDVDAILIAIKIASNGNELEIETECPSCNDISKFDIDLVKMMTSLRPANYEQELPVDELQIKFRPLTFREMQQVSLSQFEFQKMYRNINDPENGLSDEERTAKGKDALKMITEVTMKTLAATIQYIKANNIYVDQQQYILEFLKNCDKNIYVTIRDFGTKLKENSEIKPLDVKCPSCTHEYKQPFTLNMSDFFG